MGNWIRSAIHS